ncbi:hypothetical protein JOD43_001099 [Pullulanibacillus pueri]|uniref:Uncharacterized protein n=1 Tax=Pullulanibacillus pueri TaxID=1437324 RepID=A0A8J2ZWN1_9BACL|nr:hypothetical protein [Pullulanibacillus pueri]MBM7680933.1 hypothetical protein [Pullulanibacillus pueri]GGH81390.1 hypothetical protein GCM10007096_19220 [Pullulanibacillus pueri]
MAKDKNDIVQHGVNAAKAQAKDSQEKQYVEELASELSGSSKNATRSAKK